MVGDGAICRIEYKEDTSSKGYRILLVSKLLSGTIAEYQIEGFKPVLTSDKSGRPVWEVPLFRGKEVKQECLLIRGRCEEAGSKTIQAFFPRASNVTNQFSIQVGGRMQRNPSRDLVYLPLVDEWDEFGEEIDLCH